MPESRNNITPKVTWSQIVKLAKGNPIVAVWVIILWVSVTHPRLVFAFFIIIFIRYASPELFPSAVASQVLHNLISAIAKFLNKSW
jgi:cytochrome c oxidase assembly factor CtaG